MRSQDIAHLRLVNQQLAGTTCTTPHQLVKRMGCIQAQDYGMAKWAIGARLPDATDASVEADFNEGKFLRTHVLRPTWHFISPEDIRWMLKLSASKIRTLASPYHRQLGIDKAILRTSKKIITKALEQHRRLTRPQLTEILKKEKIATNDSRIGHLLMDAELEGLICSAGRIGKQFAYGLLDQQAPEAGAHDPGATNTGDFHGEAAIAELARRYFVTRGPATVQDFAWWAGLTLTEARKGLEEHKRILQSIQVGEREYWFSPGSAHTTSMPNHHPAAAGVPTTYLLPAFDEYAVAYKYRDDILDPAFASSCFSGLKPILVHNTRIVGTWQRKDKKGQISVEMILFQPNTRIPARALKAAKAQYVKF